MIPITLFIITDLSFKSLMKWNMEENRKKEKGSEGGREEGRKDGRKKGREDRGKKDKRRKITTKILGTIVCICA